MKTPFNEPAFPATVSINRDTRELIPHQFGNNEFQTLGVSIRDYFAAKIMATFMHGAVLPPDFDASEQFAFAARRAYEAADAMLKARDAQ